MRLRDIKPKKVTVAEVTVEMVRSVYGGDVMVEDLKSAEEIERVLALVKAAPRVTTGTTCMCAEVEEGLLVVYLDPRYELAALQVDANACACGCLIDGPWSTCAREACVLGG